MTAVKSLDDYVKYQMAQGFEKGAVGAGSVDAEMAVGLTVAQQMLNPAASSDVMSPEEVARMLKVLEADVISSLEAGDRN